MNKWVFLLIGGALIITGCDQAAPSPSAPLSTNTPAAETEAVPVTEQPVVVEIEATVEPEQAAPTKIVAPATVEPAAVLPTATAQVDPTGQPVATVEQAVAVNGAYENSYFRGSADAPVTLIDYSDFL